MRATAFVVTIALGVISSACGNSPTAPTPSPAEGNYTLTVSVVGEGNPVANAKVDAFLASNGSQVGTAVTDPAGKANFSGLGKGTYRLQLNWVFGFKSPMLQEVEVGGDSAVNFNLLPADSITLDCVQQDNGPCLQNGDTIYWPAGDLRFSGRLRRVSYPYPINIGAGIGSGVSFGTVTDRISVTPHNPGNVGPNDVIMYLITGFIYEIGEDTWSMTSKPERPYYPCRCPEGVTIFQCTFVECVDRVTWSGGRMTSPAPPGGGSVEVLATSKESSFTFNLVRK